MLGADAGYFRANVLGFPNVSVRESFSAMIPALIVVFSFLIAIVPVFIAVWMDRPYFRAAFEIDSYKVALRELLFLASALSGMAMLEEIGDLLQRKSAASAVVVMVVIFGFLLVIIFSMFRYGQLARSTLDELKAETSMQVWLSWTFAVGSGVVAGWLKTQAGG